MSLKSKLKKFIFGEEETATDNSGVIKIKTTRIKVEAEFSTADQCSSILDDVSYLITHSESREV